MRQVWVKVPQGSGERITDLAKKHHGLNLLKWQGEQAGQPVDVVVMNIANQQFSALFKDLENIESAQVTLFPQDVYPLDPTSKQVPDKITHVTQRSPVEVWLNGLQSIGSWKGFLGYALAASIIVWIGIYTNTPYLLVGAMLVAPFASPAMNFAMATATGDPKLLWRNLLRYFVSLLLTVIITGGLSLIFQQKTPSSTMIEISQVSSVALLLPLTAGAVGAHNLSQAKNNSLIPGAVTGTLIAASLAPPAGLVGMAGALGRWDLVSSGLFLLALQLVAINIAGSLVFRYYQLSPQNTELDRGRAAFFRLSLGASLVFIAAILFWQFSNSPTLQYSSRAQRAASTAIQYIQTYPHAEPVSVEMRFTRPSPDDNNLLLGLVYVEANPQASLSDEQIRDDLTQGISNKLQAEGFNVEPLITVTVLHHNP